MGLFHGFNGLGSKMKLHEKTLKYRVFPAKVTEMLLRRCMGIAPMGPETRTFFKKNEVAGINESYSG